jgi:iron complex transport system substrate-binding protein
MKKIAILVAIAAIATGCWGRQKPTNQPQEPVKRIICLSSSHVAFLNEIGATDRIVGVSGAEFITDSVVRTRFAVGDIIETGWDGNFDLEKIAAAQPDLVLANRPEETTRLTEMGLKCVIIEDWLEESPLEKARWIIKIGELCGLKTEAEARFTEISNSYNALAEKVKKALENGEKRPVVMFNAPYRDVWYAPGDENYMVRLVEDAGGEYALKGRHSGTQSRPMDIEEAYAAMLRTDVWLNVNNYSTLPTLLADCQRFSNTPPVKNGAVFNNNARTTPAGGSDFWESGTVRPDLILRDLIAILHPDAAAQENSAAAGDATLFYYRKLR